MAWPLHSNLIVQKIFLIESCILLESLPNTKLENPILLYESVIPSTKYGMLLILNIIFDRKLHRINI
jgi:hypothetical protein